MKVVLLLFLIFGVSMAFRFDGSEEPGIITSDNFVQGNLKECTNDQAMTVFEALEACDGSDRVRSANCIDYRLQNRLNQKWNIFINQKNGSSVISFWVIGWCYLSLENYGKYERTFTLWPAYNYQVSQSSSHHIQKQKTSFTPCPQSQYIAVNSTFVDCDLQNDQETASCIKNRMINFYNEYWNIRVSRDKNFTLFFKYFDQCWITYTGVGKYRREVFAWKAA